MSPRRYSQRRWEADQARATLAAQRIDWQQFQRNLELLRSAMTSDPFAQSMRAMQWRLAESGQVFKDFVRQLPRKDGAFVIRNGTRYMILHPPRRTGTLR